MRERIHAFNLLVPKKVPIVAGPLAWPTLRCLGCEDQVGVIEKEPYCEPHKEGTVDQHYYSHRASFYST